MRDDAIKVRTSRTRTLVILQGGPKASVISMRDAIVEQTGTPQNPVDWSGYFQATAEGDMEE